MGYPAQVGSFHETSAYPGQGGNTVINGHRDIRGSVFRRLDQLQAGDEIIVYVGDIAYAYSVAEVIQLPARYASAQQEAQHLQLMGPMPEERLTLITCTPTAVASHRLYVIARPPEDPSGY